MAMEVQKDSVDTDSLVKELEFTVPDNELALFDLEVDQDPTCEKVKSINEKLDSNSGNFLCEMDLFLLNFF